MDRTVLHCDCNSFFASVECVFSPELKNVPMAVAGSSDARHGIILAKNELAKKYNIKTAETVWQAKKKCPELVLVPPRHGEYSKFSKMVNEIYLQYTDLVEPFGIDESWLDVSGSTSLFGNGEKIADEIRKRVKKEIGLTVSVGVSFNKIFAKLGSDYKKPDATTVISRENYKNIVFPLPVADLLFVGKSTCETLHKFGVYTIGQLAAFDKAVLERTLGKMGAVIYDYANGNDLSPVERYDKEDDIKSVGNGMTFKRDLVAIEDIRLGISVLSESVARRLRAKGLKCSTIQLAIKDPAFKTLSRQKPLLKPTNLAKEIAAEAEVLFCNSWKNGSLVRAITVTATGLAALDEPEQLSFLDENNNKKQEILERTIDKIRERYGNDIVTNGRILNNDIGIDKEI